MHAYESGFFFVWVIIGFPAVGLKPKTIKYCCKQLLITNFLRKKPPLLKPDEEVSGGGEMASLSFCGP